MNTIIRHESRYEIVTIKGVYYVADNYTNMIVSKGFRKWEIGMNLIARLYLNSHR